MMNNTNNINYLNNQRINMYKYITNLHYKISDIELKLQDYNSDVFNSYDVFMDTYNELSTLKFKLCEALIELKNLDNVNL